ncbi:type II toxin-antitoxin system VapC family toxin [Pararhizobium sp. BT-229]|uniref:type II toxin-antitoxin system VapC family toxin n=1 Tax=Pararhizobium sp. BT-229 TaxID=2986923 RepID=UPI0021F75973|nr:type II toxin-antitoxin system VapC family toxin [Pararhizobium sp. BT-229]MCV9962104.1 type II toxin-antitoxin system VapC family toxin [Pararhizobium sp. BT-229]
MKPVTRIYLDTNIFIYAFEETSQRSNLLAQLFTVSSSAGACFVISELSLSELLVKPYRDADDVMIDQYEGFLLTSDWLEVLSVVRPTLAYAAVLRSQNKGLKLPDAIHLSTAIGASCSHFLTGDMGIVDTYELIHLRYGITKKAQPLTVIRPDEPTLNSLLKSLAA